MSDQNKQKIISEYNKNPGYKSFLSWPGGGPENLNSSVWTFDGKRMKRVFEKITLDQAITEANRLINK